MFSFGPMALRLTGKLPETAVFKVRILEFKFFLSQTHQQLPFFVSFCCERSSCPFHIAPCLVRQIARVPFSNWEWIYNSHAGLEINDFT